MNKPEMLKMRIEQVREDALGRVCWVGPVVDPVHQPVDFAGARHARVRARRLRRKANRWNRILAEEQQAQEQAMKIDEMQKRIETLQELVRAAEGLAEQRQREFMRVSREAVVLERTVKTQREFIAEKDKEIAVLKRHVADQDDAVNTLQDEVAEMRALASDGIELANRCGERQWWPWQRRAQQRFRGLRDVFEMIHDHQTEA